MSVTAVLFGLVAAACGAAYLMVHHRRRRSGRITEATLIDWFHKHRGE